MKEKLKIYLSQLNILSSDEIEYSVTMFENVIIKKNDFFVSEKKLCNQIAFIFKGGVRSFSIAENGEDNTTCFKFENQFITSYESFISKKKSKKSIQAIEDCDLLVINRTNFLYLMEKFPSWISVQNFIIQQEFIEKENYLNYLKNTSAKDKYLHILNEKPEIAKRASVNHIASYLGITQRTLTRVKKGISFQTF
ncbi:Crp/Fnr family transcriptional regulator [Empedobacter tilapiae]|uniref:Crp/Fnr family transcriptional regulator n=1 Tax=Empedobacter tilapiae TaxID=2491114 RepID=UPI0028D4A446|nr:Crp/Fnr family transcriptional regulator [Empedobacter tilapiae]